MLILLQQLRVFDNFLTDSDLSLLVMMGLDGMTGISAILRVVRVVAERPRLTVNDGATAGCGVGQTNGN